MGKDDWPASSYNAAMMADLRRRGTAPSTPARSTVEPELTEAQQRENEAKARLTEKQKQLIAYHRGETTKHPQYKTYASERAAVARLRRKGIL